MLIKELPSAPLPVDRHNGSSCPTQAQNKWEPQVKGNKYTARANPTEHSEITVAYHQRTQHAACDKNERRTERGTCEVLLSVHPSDLAHNETTSKLTKPTLNSNHGTELGCENITA